MLRITDDKFEWVSCNIILKTRADPNWRIFQRHERQVNIYVEKILSSSYYFKTIAESYEELSQETRLIIKVA